MAGEDRGLGVCVGTPPGPDPGRTHLKEDLDVVKGWDWPNTHCLPAVIYGSWLAPPYPGTGMAADQATTTQLAPPSWAPPTWLDPSFGCPGWEHLP